jgi:tetratricopeptide (TPR) repeat protein
MKPKRFEIVLVIFLICRPCLLRSQSQDWEEQAWEALKEGRLNVARELSQRALEHSTDNGPAQEILGRVAFAEKNFAEAAPHLRTARSMGRNSVGVGKLLAQALQRVGQHEEACKILEAELRRDSLQADLRYDLAECYFAQGKPREALPHLEEAYKQGLRHAGVLLQLSRARFAVGQDDLAVDLLASAASQSSSPNLLLQIGKLLFENLLYTQSITTLKKAWEQQTGSHEIGMYLALAHFQLEQYEQSNRILEEIKGASDSLEYHNLRGSTYARLGRWTDAQEEFQTAIHQWPRQADGYLNAGLFYLERGDSAKATELLEKGASLMTPGSKVLYTVDPGRNCQGLSLPEDGLQSDPLKGEFYGKLASALHKRQHYVTALQVYQLALRMDAHNPAAYGGIGLICQELGNPTEGEAFLLRGVKLHPNKPELHYYLGSVQFALGKYDQAISSYRRAIELERPHVPGLHWVHLGVAQLSAETWLESEKSFLSALEQEPDLALAHYELGKLYLKRKEYDRAEHSFEKAIELDPLLSGAYYQYGQACIRNGKPEQGQALLTTFERKKALRASTKRYDSREEP